MKRKNTSTSILFLSFFILFATADLEAQQSKNMITPFKKGSITLNLGIGFGAAYKNEYARTAAFGTKAALEYGVWQAGPGVVSLGVETGITTSNKSNGKYNDDFRAHTFVVAGRSAWHFGWKVPGLDTYAGLSAGAGFDHYDYIHDDQHYDYNNVIPVIGAFVGVSYFFTPAFGVNAEAGYDITCLQGGVIFKFR